MRSGVVRAIGLHPARASSRWSPACSSPVYMVVAAGLDADDLGAGHDGPDRAGTGSAATTIAKALVASVMVSEDGQYCAHHGVDWAELNKVWTTADGTGRAAPRPSPCRRSGTCSCGRRAPTSARRSKSRWRSTPTRPGQAADDGDLPQHRRVRDRASSASRPRPGTISGVSARASRPARRRSWPPPCPIRRPAIRPGPRRCCGRWPAPSRRGPGWPGAYIDCLYPERPACIRRPTPSFRGL